ncbi:MAG: hypothetical protein HUU60_01275 [Armatimonadetes bacterium]|nr:hypothetical protein [Armatimonadota bacterium]
MILASLLCLLVGLSSDSKNMYPLAKAIACPPVAVDVSDAPEAKEWGETAKALVEAWHPKVTELLATDGRDPVTGGSRGEAYKPPAQIKLVFKKTLNVPAHASGDTITISADWIARNPNDLGMVVHELTHIVQQYPPSRAKPGWLVEGIADYIRWWRYEPELHAGSGRTKIDAEKSNYTDSYRTTAKWLAWCSRKYDMRLVPALDKALRHREDPMPLFEKLTGKSADALWKEFVSDQS